MFYLYSDATEKNTETGESRRYVDLWPLFTYRRDFNGNTRLQVLALLEPIIPGSHSIERNWSPFWSLWRSEKNPKAGAASQSLLWNLYRHDTAPEHKCVAPVRAFPVSIRRHRQTHAPVLHSAAMTESGGILAGELLNEPDWSDESDWSDRSDARATRPQRFRRSGNKLIWQRRPMRATLCGTVTAPGMNKPRRFRAYLRSTPTLRV